MFSYIQYFILFETLQDIDVNNTQVQITAQSHRDQNTRHTRLRYILWTINFRSSNLH